MAFNVLYCFIFLFGCIFYSVLPCTQLNGKGVEKYEESLWNKTCLFFQELPFWYSDTVKSSPVQSIWHQQRDLWNFHATNAGMYEFNSIKRKWGNKEVCNWFSHTFINMLHVYFCSLSILCGNTSVITSVTITLWYWMLTMKGSYDLGGDVYLQ